MTQTNGHTNGQPKSAKTHNPEAIVVNVPAGHDAAIYIRNQYLHGNEIDVLEKVAGENGDMILDSVLKKVVGQSFDDRSAFIAAIAGNVGETIRSLATSRGNSVFVR